MLSDFLDGIRASKYRRYVCVGKVMLRHVHLSVAVKELNKGLPSCQCLEITTLHDVFKKFD